MNDVYIEKFKEELKELIGTEETDVANLLSRDYSSNTLLLNLNYSVLTGEFIGDDGIVESIEKSLETSANDLRKFQSDLENALIEADRTQDYEKKASIVNVFINSHIKSLTYYFDFINAIKYNHNQILPQGLTKHRLSNTLIDGDLFTKIESTKEYKLQKPSNSKISEYIQLLLLNLYLCEIDEFLECDIDIANKLEKLKDEFDNHREGGILQDIQNDEICEILQDKCTFLLNKINYREWLLAKKKGGLISKEPEPEFICDDSPFKKIWDNQVRKHYGSQADLANLKFLAGDDEKTIQYYHNWAKYYRKNTAETISYRILNMEGIIEKFQRNLQDSSNFNFSFHTTLNLLNSNLLYLKLQKEEIENGFQSIVEEFKIGNPAIEYNVLKTLNEYYVSLKEKEDDNNGTSRKNLSRLRDYQGHKYLLEFIDRFTGYLRQNVKEWVSFDSTNKDDMEKLQDLKEVKRIQERERNKIQQLEKFYGKVLESYKQNLKFWQKHKLFPIYLDTKTCKKYEYKIGESVHNIFIDSSYILPNSYETSFEEWYGKESYIGTATRSLRNRVELELQFMSFNASRVDFDKKVKENEFKVIQIVALFVSVATYSLGSIKVFDGRTLKESLSVVFALASGLTLFNAFFRWLVVGQLQAWIPILPFDEFFEKIKLYLIKPNSIKTHWKNVWRSTEPILIIDKSKEFVKLIFHFPIRPIIFIIIGIFHVLYNILKLFTQPRIGYSFIMMIIIVLFASMSFWYANESYKDLEKIRKSDSTNYHKQIELLLKRDTLQNKDIERLKVKVFD